MCVYINVYKYTHKYITIIAQRDKHTTNGETWAPIPYLKGVSYKS